MLLVTVAVQEPGSAAVRSRRRIEPRSSSGLKRFVYRKYASCRHVFVNRLLGGSARTETIGRKITPLTPQSYERPSFLRAPDCSDAVKTWDTHRPPHLRSQQLWCKQAHDPLDSQRGATSYNPFNFANGQADSGRMFRASIFDTSTETQRLKSPCFFSFCRM